MGAREERLNNESERVHRGGPPRGHEKLAESGRMFVRDRLRLFFDGGEMDAEVGTMARNFEAELAADGVVTGSAHIDGQSLFFTASDYSVKAGSIGRYHGEKLIRAQEAAIRAKRPILYLVDSSGARIDETAGHHVDKKGGGQLFYYHSIMSGFVPQVGVLYGTCFAGTAYTPVFCDLLVAMDDAAMAIASPRMVEMAIGQKTTPAELGGAKMHAEVSGSVDFLAGSEEEAAQIVRRIFEFLPASCEEKTPLREARPPATDPAAIDDIIPPDPNRPYPIKKLIDAVVDEGSFLEVKAHFAKELVVGFARVEGMAVGIVANDPSQKGGTLFPDSSDKGAEFVWLCDAYNIPLVYLVDTPGFMVGTAVERAGILRRGRKFIFATSSATVPRICVIVRKSYGAGIYAMSGPAYDPDVTLALPSAEIAVMGPEAAINAVYLNRLTAIEDPEERKALTERLRNEYRESYDIYRLAGEMVVDELVLPSDLRRQLAHYLDLYKDKEVPRPTRRHGTII